MDTPPLMQELCTYVAYNQPPFVVGGTLITGAYTPVSPDFCHLMLERTPARIDAYLRNTYTFFFQLWSRGPDYWPLYQSGVELLEFLHSIQNVALPDWTLFTVTGSLPCYMGVDSKDRHTFSANIQLRVRRES